MRIHYDAAVDAAYILFREEREEVTTVRLTEDIAVDFGPGEQVHGIEVLCASEHLGIAPDAASITLENLSTRSA